MSIGPRFSRKRGASLVLALVVSVGSSRAAPPTGPAAVLRQRSNPVAGPVARPLAESPTAAVAQKAAERDVHRPAERTALEPPRFEIASADGRHALRLSALVHADARVFFADSGLTSFVVRRARASLDARVHRVLELKLQPDVAGGRVSLLDAYGNFHYQDEIQLLVGKGKAPLGLERLRTPKAIAFAERGFPTLLVANRDVGAKLHGKLFGQSVEWAVGAYNGVPNGQSGDVDANRAKDIAGRLFLQPFAEIGPRELRGAGIGLSGAYGNEQGALAPYVTSGQQPFFSYTATTTALGRRTVISPQGYFFLGPLGVTSELVRVREHLVSASGASGTVGTTAFQVAGQWVFGGQASYGGVKPNRPFDPERGGFGALALEARYHTLRVGDLAYRRGFASRDTAAVLAKAFTVGGTYQLAEGERALIDYERTTFRGGAPNGGNRTPESLLVARLEASF